MAMMAVYARSANLVANSDGDERINDVQYVSCIAHSFFFSSPATSAAALE